MRALTLLALLSMWLARPVAAQTWRRVLTTATVSSLWVDYCQIRYGHEHGSETWVLGQQLTPASLVAVNALETVLNLSAPRKYRPALNILTLAFHVVAIYKTSRRQIGYLETKGGWEVARIGIRLWP